MLYSGLQRQEGWRYGMTLQSHHHTCKGPIATCKQSRQSAHASSKRPRVLLKLEAEYGHSILEPCDSPPPTRTKYSVHCDASECMFHNHGFLSSMSDAQGAINAHADVTPARIFSGPPTSARPRFSFEALVHRVPKSHGRTSILCPWSFLLPPTPRCPLRAPHSLPLAIQTPRTTSP
jgi:hypothetical protein